MEKTHKDITTLYNIMHSLYSSLSYQQIILHIQSILANLQDSLHYMWEATIHTMDYVDAAATGILSPHVLLVEDLREILKPIEETLPSTMHLPISSEDTLHFYRYLCTHVLIADEQFLLLINVPIQDHAQQIEVYEVFNLDIPHRNYSACYDIQNKYLGIMLDETSTIEISEDQFKMCQKVNRQFCILNTPLLQLANQPPCVSVCQGKGQYPEKMFPTDKEGQQHWHTNIHSSKFLDNNFTNKSSTCQNHTHLPWRSTQNYHTTDTHPYTLTTISMQCHITAFSPATTL